MYNWLPLCHLLEGTNRRVLVMHGGLFSSDEVTLEDLRKIERNRQPPEDVNFIFINFYKFRWIQFIFPLIFLGSNVWTSMVWIYLKELLNLLWNSEKTKLK